jgi:hypothetical protein
MHSLFVPIALLALDQVGVRNGMRSGTWARTIGAVRTW